jgi:tetratricopeptide (TPR) repeat protein
MHTTRRGFILLALLLALAGALYQASQLAPGVAANRERLEALHALVDSERSGTVDELAWDAGWRSLCSATAETAAAASSQAAVEFLARSHVDRGDYASALVEFRRVAAGGDAAEASLASAYVAALELRWLDAARLYPGQPTPRHQRFWGTVFYLAAQELMFRAQAGEAADWYRQADQSYGVQGPYLGLGLVDCLAQQGRTLEAFDAYRRALVVLPADEALAQRERFEQMRLEALRAWQKSDPANQRVARWLEFYSNDTRAEGIEEFAGEPTPTSILDEDIGDGNTLIGIDYQEEDIETGPFVWVDMYLKNGSVVERRRRVAFNYAPNGAFVWDAAPDGVSPFGWYTRIYNGDMAALRYQRTSTGDVDLCMDSARIGAGFDFQGFEVPLKTSEPHAFLQGGISSASEDGVAALCRRWSGTLDENPFNCVQPLLTGPSPRASTAGTTSIPANADRLSAWIVSSSTAGVACFGHVFLTAIPPIGEESQHE